jgi:L-ascorbate metabolism protein UlaG (beta-lactamase superfamily)
VLLTDPIFSDRASPVGFAGPRRVRPPGVALADLPRVDIILLSHNHYDHMDIPSLRALQARCNPTIVTGLANGAYLARKGVPGAIELDWWQAVEMAELRITYVPAQHWSGRGLRDRRHMLWGGFVVESAAGRIYFAGDTGFFTGFDTIRSRCGPPDVALLPIGAYEPRWLMTTQHMNPAEAVEAHRMLEAQRSLGMHWGTFQLTDEGIDEPRRALDVAKAEAGLAAEDFLAPVPGETVLWQRPESALAHQRWQAR